jgi:hypothetical protein
MKKLNSNLNSGFSTLELLIAFSILVLSMSAVVMVAFGNQSIAIDTELAQRGLYLAEKRLEETGAALKNSFDSVGNEFAASAFDAIYDTQVEIEEISPCLKEVKSQAFWNRDLRDLGNSLSMMVTDPEISQALSHDCASEKVGDQWDNPDTLVMEDFGGQGSTAIDEFNHLLYLTSDPGTSANKSELFIYEFDSDDLDLTELSQLDLGTDNNGQKLYFSLYDVDVIENYAFVASASTTAQLQVIDVTDPSDPKLKWNVGLPGVDSTGSQPAGRVVYYFDGRVYVGTRETAGPEFHIFDVSGDLSTTPPSHLGSLELNHSVKDIVVRDGNAYLATTDNNHELMVIDVTNPGSLEHPDDSDLGYNAAGDNDGSAVYVTGDRVYLGRTQNQNPLSAHDFFILNRDDVLDDTATNDGLLGSHDLGIANDAVVNGIRVSSNLAFLALDDSNVSLAVYNISDPADIFPPASCSEYNFSENNSGIDNDNDYSYLFISNSSQNDIRVIYDQDAVCE